MVTNHQTKAVTSGQINLTSIKDAKRDWPQGLATMAAESRAVVANIEKQAKAVSPLNSSLKYGGPSKAKRRLRTPAIR